MGEILILDGKPEGLWKYYDYDGNLVKEVSYKDAEPQPPEKLSRGKVKSFFKR